MVLKIFAIHRNIHITRRGAYLILAFFSVSGGAGAAHEAEQFSWNDHIVIPVKVTGGAAGGKFNVPQKIFQVQKNAEFSIW